MLIFFIGLTAVLMVAVLSRDHDISVSQETVVAARLDMGPVAIAELPHQIHLLPVPLREFAVLDRILMTREGLASEGFRDAGGFRIDELPGVAVVLMVHPSARMTAAIYSHERAGVWVEAVSRYADDRRCTHTTLDGTDLETRPGNTLVSLPGVSIAELLARARADRPADRARPVSVPEAKALFESDYAGWIADRKAWLDRDDDADHRLAA